VRCSKFGKQDTFDFQRNLAKILLSNGLRCLAISSSLTRLLVRMPAILLGSDVSIGASMLCSLNSELMLVACPQMEANLRKSLFLKLTPDMRYLMYMAMLHWYPF
jgi:hypothetical protein